MRAVVIALKDLKIVARDFKALAIIIAMPLILILILGAALGSMFTRGESISPFTVAVVDLDGGEAAKAFMDVLQSEHISKLMASALVSNESEAVELVERGKASGAVIIPKGISDFGDSSSKSFKVLVDPEHSLRGQVIRSVVESFTDQYSALFAGTSGIIASLSEAALREQQGGPAPTGPEGLGQIQTGAPPALSDPQTFRNLVSVIQEKLLAQTSRAAGLFSRVAQDHNWITASQYYTAAMTVMFVLFGGMLGAKSILEEKSQKTMARLFGTGATRTQIVAGKTLATYLISVLQILVLIAFTSLVYRTVWGDLRGVLLMTGSLAFAATGFSMMVASISKTEKVAEVAENFGIQLMAFLGGCQFPMYLFPPILTTVSRLMPTRWGLEGYILLMQGQPWGTVMKPALVLLGMGLVFLTAGIWRLDLD